MTGDCDLTDVLTVLVHPHVETFLQSAGLALVPMRLVYNAGSIASLAPVDQSPPDGSLEEPRAAVAGEDSVMFAGAGVSTNTADKPGSTSLNIEDMTACPTCTVSLLTFRPRSKWSISDVGEREERPGWWP